MFLEKVLRTMIMIIIIIHQLVSVVVLTQSLKYNRTSVRTCTVYVVAETMLSDTVIWLVSFEAVYENTSSPVLFSTRAVQWRKCMLSPSSNLIVNPE